MRKSEKNELYNLLVRLHFKFRPMEMDKMTIGDWKYMEEELSKMIVKLKRELGDE